MLLEIRLSEIALNWRTLFSAPPIAVERDWSGSPMTQRIECYVLRDALRLGFGCKVNETPDCDLGQKEGQFVAGLWERDVAELFIAGEKGLYQEFNLAPGGAWWTGIFAGYRSPQPEAFSATEEVRTVSLIGDGFWQAALFLPLSALAFEPSLQVRGHFAGVAGGAERVHWSSAPVAGIEPDFHDPRCF